MLQRKTSRFMALLCCAVCALLIMMTQGCVTTRKVSPSRSLDYEHKYVQDNEEIVEEPYIPRDDGKPLSPAELKAFNSKGDLDSELSQEDRHIVELHFKFFVHEHRRTFERYLVRSARYLPYIKQVFRDRGLPEDLAYLFMVESGGNPNAISPVGATGLWQFMPYTGKKFGLLQNAWVDERRDPFKATYAATDYLLKLYYDFSDWHLAAAAYNAGEGKIGRAVDGTGASDFFELCRLDCNLEERKRLKEETRQYVPRLLAVAKIMRNLKALGFEEPSLDDAYDLKSIDVPPGTNLRGFATALGLTWDEFSAMNPGFKRTASPPTAKSIAYIPPQQMQVASAWLRSDDARLYAAWKEYTVKKRDTLASISRQQKVSVAALRQANNFQRLPKAGSVIMIPGGSKPIEPVIAALPDKGSKTIPGRAGKYTVVSGDTLYSLAQKWGTDVESIRQLNRLGSTGLALGQRLSIPANSKHVKATPVAQARSKESAKTPGRREAVASPLAKVGGTHTVKGGESWYGIARRYGISAEQLAKANNSSPKAKLGIGQKLRIPDGRGAQAEASAAGKVQAAQSKDQAVKQRPTPSQQTKVAKSPKKPAQAPVKGAKKTIPGDKTKVTKVTVGQGDTLYSLAKKYGTSVEVLRKVNNLKDGAAIKSGQRLVIP